MVSHRLEDTATAAQSEYAQQAQNVRAHLEALRLADASGGGGEAGIAGSRLQVPGPRRLVLPLVIAAARLSRHRIHEGCPGCCLHMCTRTHVSQLCCHMPAKDA